MDTQQVTLTIKIENGMPRVTGGLFNRSTAPAIVIDEAAILAELEAERAAIEAANAPKPEPVYSEKALAMFDLFELRAAAFVAAYQADMIRNAQSTSQISRKAVRAAIAAKQAA